MAAVSEDVYVESFYRHQTMELVKQEIENYEIKTKTKFAVVKKDKSFGCNDFELKGHKIMFEDVKLPKQIQQIEFSGVSFIIVGLKILECEHGKDYNESRKRRRALNGEDCTPKRNRTSKKFNCPAKIVIRDVVEFPDIKASSNTRHKRRMVSEVLRKQWNTDKANVKYMRSYYVKLPDESMHRFHSLGEDSKRSAPRKRKIPKQSKASECRDLLNQLNSLTYVVYDSEALGKLHEILGTALKELTAQAPKEQLFEDELLEEPCQDENDMLIPKKSSQNTNSNLGESSTNQVIEEVIPYNVNDQYTISMEEVESDNTPTSIPNSLQLSNDMYANVLNNEILTDETMNIAQKILSDQFPHIDGFQHIVFGDQNQNFSTVKKDSPFIQFLYSPSLKHWVCVANMEKGRRANNKCDFYDSQVCSSISALNSKDIIRQIAAFSLCQAPEITINQKAVQQQANEVNCGVFSIAFATSLALGEDPTNILFDENLMRQHLVICLRNSKLEVFPRVDSSEHDVVNKCGVKSTVVELHCSCRMPFQLGQEMMECFGCKQLFHLVCEKQTAEIQWQCKKCTKKKDKAVLKTENAF